MMTSPFCSSMSWDAGLSPSWRIHRHYHFGFVLVPVCLVFHLPALFSMLILLRQLTSLPPLLWESLFLFLIDIPLCLTDPQGEQQMQDGDKEPLVTSPGHLLQQHPKRQWKKQNKTKQNYQLSIEQHEGVERQKKNKNQKIIWNRYHQFWPNQQRDKDGQAPLNTTKPKKKQKNSTEDQNMIIRVRRIPLWRIGKEEGGG